MGSQQIPFHADVSLPPASAAGTVTLYDPLSARVIVSHIRISTDTAQRIIVGTADTDGTRMAGGWLPAGGAGILADLALDTQATSMMGQPILVFTSEAGALEVQIEGCIVVVTP